MAACCRPHSTGNGSITAGSVIPPGCRPLRMASTMPGASGVRCNCPASIAFSILTVLGGRPRTEKAAPSAAGWVRRRQLLVAVPECSLSKYGFQASGVRTTAGADRAEIDLVFWFLSSVLNCPSQEVRRETASGERFSPVSTFRQSTGLPQKPQEICNAARGNLQRSEALGLAESNDRMGTGGARRAGNQRSLQTYRAAV